MRKQNSVWLGIVFAVLIMGSMGKAVWAQDPVQVDPNIYKVIFENEKVRVSDVKFKPGDKLGKHSHPDHLVYVLSSGTLKITPVNGKGEEVIAKEGDVIWSPAVTHRGENIGKTDVNLLVIELKGPPAAIK